jgi:hypothetical protein
LYRHRRLQGHGQLELQRESTFNGDKHFPGDSATTSSLLTDHHPHGLQVQTQVQSDPHRLRPPEPTISSDHHLQHHIDTYPPTNTDNQSVSLPKDLTNSITLPYATDAFRYHRYRINTYIREGIARCLRKENEVFYWMAHRLELDWTREEWLSWSGWGEFKSEVAADRVGDGQIRAKSGGGGAARNTSGTGFATKASTAQSPQKPIAARIRDSNSSSTSTHSTSTIRSKTFDRTLSGSGSEPGPHAHTTTRSTITRIVPVSASVSHTNASNHLEQASCELEELTQQLKAYGKEIQYIKEVHRRTLESDSNVSMI